MSDVTGIKMSDFLVLNYLYEFEAFCTSIITKSADGTILHGRNLDFAYPDEMRDITFIGNFYKGGVHIFDGVLMAGVVGVYTGVKEGAFSVSENFRFQDKDFQSFLNNILTIFKGGKEISWITREALTTCSTFECALAYFVSTPVIAPGYLTMAGVKEYEGAVVSRDKLGAAHIEMLSAS